MNIRILCDAGIFAFSLVLAGCGTTPPMPRVSYPVTYQIQVGNTQVRSDYGPQNLNLNATQDVTVPPGQPLYYQIVSPVDIIVYVYEGNSQGSHTFLGQNQGTMFTSSVVPNTSSLQFAFSVTQPNSTGALRFTISDQPIPPGVVPLPATSQ